jgi:hypothetical protein
MVEAWGLLDISETKNITILFDRPNQQFSIASCNGWLVSLEMRRFG